MKICIGVSVVATIVSAILDNNLGKNSGAAPCGMLVAVAGGMAAAYFHSQTTTAKSKRKLAIANEEARIRAILDTVNRLATSFRSEVEPLLRELQIAVTLNDLERMVSELERYGNWGRELESYYIKT